MMCDLKLILVFFLISFSFAAEINNISNGNEKFDTWKQIDPARDTLQFEIMEQISLKLEEINNKIDRKLLNQKTKRIEEYNAIERNLNENMQSTLNAQFTEIRKEFKENLRNMYNELTQNTESKFEIIQKNISDLQKLFTESRLETKEHYQNILTYFSKDLINEKDYIAQEQFEKMHNTLLNNYETMQNDISKMREIIVDQHQKEAVNRSDSNMLNTLHTNPTDLCGLLQKIKNETELINTNIRVLSKDCTIKNETKSKYPSNCAEAVPKHGLSGVYSIKLEQTDVKPIRVYCEVDPKGGPAWTIIQRRTNGNIDFYKNWEHYKHGFGNISAEFFIGLDTLHSLTNATKQELWIKLEDFENKIHDAKYSSFGVGNENEGYALHELGQYSGNAKDGLTYHKGCKFSTHNNDNDNFKNSNCARTMHGAWWYNSCYHSNLNGPYKRKELYKKSGVNGISWMYLYYLEYTHMAIRPTTLH